MTEKAQNRRNFLKYSALMAALPISGLNSCVINNSTVKNEKVFRVTEDFVKLPELKKPVAIAMWDFSWLLRHHKLGEFEDFDKVLDGLVERGYNAIRMDAFPHLVASGKDGNIQEKYYHSKDDWKPVLWGNNCSMYSTPRKSLVEFLSKCKDRNISIGLSTWFLGHGTKRNLEFEGKEGFIRAWDETLTFLNEQNLFDNVLYVDVLNEYPLWHGFEWLRKEMDSILNTKQNLNANPDAHIADINTLKNRKIKYNPAQQKFYKKFISEVLLGLKKKWPQLNFFTSFSNSEVVPWEEADFTGFEGLDAHIWFTHFYDFGMSTGYYDNVHKCKNDLGFEKTQKAMNAYWKTNKPELIEWMDQELGKREAIAKKHNLICGNTEGWGPINWYEHPLMTWDFTKEAGAICVDLALKHNFRFICTSNFTHPQFKTIWNDIEWHKKLTTQIKKAVAI